MSASSAKQNLTALRLAGHQASNLNEPARAVREPRHSVEYKGQFHQGTHPAVSLDLCARESDSREIDTAVLLRRGLNAAARNVKRAKRRYNRAERKCRLHS
ncbi:MAG TPA: hypothetical protein VHZ74_11285, partial [Bryobacteraceae bacterium]|nr:hypothetical protein [Bryobacteraceae bacterium]